MRRKIGIVGAGAWGTALAVAARRAGRDVVLWARNPELAAQIDRDRENGLYLPRIRLDPAIGTTTELDAVARADAILLAVPAQHLRVIVADLAPHLPADCPIVSCTKGVEAGSLKLMSEVVAEVLPKHRIAVLSGPNFAMEVAQGLPAATTLASIYIDVAAELVEALGSRSFRPYLSEDPVGAQVGGAVKNVVAIACGVVAGRGLGDNARAALVTRGLAEIVRLGLALGGRAETLMGLSGLGDVMLTCSAMQSRNYSLGVALGEGNPLQKILASRHSVTEGVHSASAVCALATRHGVDMPISVAVDAVLNHNAEIDATIDALLARPFKIEHL